MRKIITLIIAIAFIGMSAIAQKVGHLNSVELMGKIPAVKSANSQLESLSTQRKTRGEQMVKAFQAKIRETESKINELSPVQRQKISEDLKRQEQEIMAYEQQVQKELAEKEKSLLQPILDKANKAISDVAKENGYSYIFDTSVGALLHVSPSEDVSALVLKKLGL